MGKLPKRKPTYLVHQIQNLKNTQQRVTTKTNKTQHQKQNQHQNQTQTLT